MVLDCKVEALDKIAARKLGLSQLISDEARATVQEVISTARNALDHDK